MISKGRKMIQELLQKKPLIPHKHKKYFEVSNRKVRIFGKCEVTDENFEMFVPTDQFYRYLQQDCSISVSLPSVPKEEQEFILSGTSPAGWKELWK